MRFFTPVFCGNTLSGPLINRLKQFCKLFCFHEDIQLQSFKFVYPNSLRLYVVTEVLPYMQVTPIFKCLNYCYRICSHFIAILQFSKMLCLRKISYDAIAQVEFFFLTQSRGHKSCKSVSLNISPQDPHSYFLITSLRVCNLLWHPSFIQVYCTHVQHVLTQGVLHTSTQLLEEVHDWHVCSDDEDFHF